MRGGGRRRRELGRRRNRDEQELTWRSLDLL
jgi:hypothetical protein